MGQLYTFHETVIGHLHVMNGFPCEDSSASYSAQDGRYHIAVVADGHGSKACFRSERGSRAAAETAMKALREFAENTLASEETENRFYQDMFTNPRYRQLSVRQLTDSIVAGWYDSVMEDYKNDPPTAEEYGEYAAQYEGGKNTAHIYGTTLIAALQLPKCLILMQQGDGRCDVFYADGTMDQPIPWDDRCVDNVTTSICDEDAAESFRSQVVNLEEKPVMACFLACDGVEDAYRDTYEALEGSHILMGGVHTFFKDLSCQLVNMGTEEFESYLKTMLPEFSADGRFSRSGSGDDVSVSGIVDIETLAGFTDAYVKEVRRYALEEDLFWKEEELRGKTRKHGILQKRFEDAQAAYDEEKKKLDALEEEVKMREERVAVCEEEAEQAKQALEEYRETTMQQMNEQAQEEQEETEDGVKRRPVFNIFAPSTKGVLQQIFQHESQKETDYRNKEEQLRGAQALAEQARTARDEAASASLQDLEEKLAEAKAAFEEYDEKYQAIETERAAIAEQIAAL